MKTLQILIADDHELVRKGLRTVLENQPGWKVCGEATNGRQAVELAKQLGPDVIVLDVTMPELNGLEATRQILKAIPKAEVLILTMHESEKLVSEVLAAGAHGYILKADTSRLLVSAIELLAQHQPFFTGKISEVVLSGYLNPGKIRKGAASPVQRLTAREREIVQLLAEGKTNKEVAVALGVNVKTVDAHRANVMHKLDLHSVTDLVRYAIRNHIIEA
ncbi:MAG: response regulator transcription factor [Verrucomicrobia bacterium]|nr:response regulator transcription factor [Verrucomicrobiota bacterium]